MDTFASPLETSARETLTALDELRRHERLLVGSWRELVDSARHRLEHAESDRQRHLSVRTAWLAAATAAGEAAQTARFEARLLECPSHQLASARAKLESHVNSLRLSQMAAAARFEATVDALLSELASRLACAREQDGLAWTARDERRLIDGLVTAMRAYGDQVQQILLNLGDAARATFGVSVGTAVPLHVPREPPRPKPSHPDARDGTVMAEDVADAVRGSVELHQDRLDGRVDDAIRSLRSRLDRATEDQERRADTASERAAQLMREAQELDELADRLYRTLPTGLEAPVNPKPLALTTYSTDRGHGRPGTGARHGPQQ